MKRIKLLSLLLTLALLMSLCPAAFAAAQDFTYTVNTDGTLTLTGYSGAESNLTIPSQIEGKTISAIGESCFAGLLCLKRVHIPEGVEVVEDYAFEACSMLEKVYFPDSLKTIGDGVFSGCGKLTLADLQDGITSIGKGAFLFCTSLVHLELPAALETLGDFAFADCQSLAGVRFRGDAVTRLPDRLFYGCEALSQLRLPSGITQIGKRTFSRCESLQNLYFGEPLMELGAYAFENCSELSGADLRAESLPAGLFSGCYALNWFSVADGTNTIHAFAFSGSGISSLNVPASVEAIEPGAFCGMHGSVMLDEENTNYQLIDGSLYTADGKTLLAYFPSDPYAEEPQTAFTVPDGVEVIASYALAESGLTAVDFPASLKKIEAYAFADTHLEDPQIPEGVETDPLAFASPHDAGGYDPDVPGEETVPEIIGSVAGDKNLFREEDFAGYREIANDDFDAWCDSYLAYNEAQGVKLTQDAIPYVLAYKGEVVPHFMPMTAVQNHDPDMWAQAASAFGDDFEQMYLMMDHGLFTELARGKMEDDLILYSGLYDSQLMAAAGTDVVPTQQQLVDAIGNTFADPIMISTTTDPGVAAGFGDTLFIIYASRDAVEALGAVCIDAVARSSEKEILMNANARYRILDVGNMAITHQDPWDPEPTTLYRGYVKVELLAPEKPSPDFEDVPADAYYYDAVQWAAKNGITSGVDSTHFAPNGQATRAEVVTFLWRANGSPVILLDVPEGVDNAFSFSDVSGGSYYFYAVLWAKLGHITAGTSETTFSPNKTCTRAEVVTFLWRAAGSPEPKTAECPFDDVAPGSYYEKAVLWATENGITKGAEENSFHPGATCTRAQIVTFLYRALKETAA
ncbi:MAG: leucine-rich repeat protein [Oscillospiraceae bacterium]|nr:leucine-rich repeat protein [Oscillospiraceae bacterium]